MGGGHLVSGIFCKKNVSFDICCDIEIVSIVKPKIEKVVKNIEKTLRGETTVVARQRLVSP